MSEAATTGEQPRRSGFFGKMRALDRGVFEAEKAVVAFSLVTITVVVFVDVVARRITAPDSKVGALLAKLARIDDADTRAFIDASVAPWVTLGVALLTLGFGLYSARRFKRMRDASAGVTEPASAAPSAGRELALAAGFSVVGVLVGWGFAQVFGQLESSVVYAGAFGLSAGGFAAYHFVQKREGWPLRAGAGALAGALLVWISLAYVPEGYTWSKKVSLMLLLWVGLLSASICVYAGKHIRMGAAQKLLPENARRYLNGTGFLATAVFCGLMTFLGFMYVVAPKASDDEFMTEIFTLGGTRYVFGFEGMVGRGGLLEGTEVPDWLGIIAAPIGFGIATCRFLGAAISAFLGGNYGEPSAEEGMEEAKKAALGGDEATPAARDIPPAERGAAKPDVGAEPAAAADAGAAEADAPARKDEEE
ncbi:MAG: TRAP transporter small permease subunit [Sandaracinaceae bacterium]|nr:TRAP transporter small permease subunit [Sandaracinaceae bacterium]